MRTHVSLFAGIDAIGIAAERLGYTTTACVESDEYCRAVLAKRLPHATLHDDVRTVGVHTLPPDMDLLSMGFPCQNLSSAGKGAGLNGDRSILWFEGLRIIRETRPKMVLIENVAVLKSRGLDVVVAGLADAGYGCWWDCVPALAVGAPHIRDRIWITAVPIERMPFGPMSLFEEDRVNGKMPRAGYSATDGLRIVEPQATRKDCLAALGAVKRADGVTWLTRIGQPLWPTPERSDGTGGRVASERGGFRPSGAKRAVTLGTAVAFAEPAPLYPTPSASSYGSNRGGAAGRVGPVRHPLPSMARSGEWPDEQRMWPTASARDWKSAAASPETHARNSRPLNEVVRREEDQRTALRTGDIPANRCLRKDQHIGDCCEPELCAHCDGSLNRQNVQRMWPTPAASDDKRGVGRSSHSSRPGPNLRTAVAEQQGGGPLNPSWVEWLMGLPIGWTDVDCDEPVHADWLTEHGIPRVARDVLSRKQRLMAIGNSLVWRVAYARIEQAHRLLGVR